MRISDWSSDVCSSDLVGGDEDHAVCGAGGAILALLGDVGVGAGEPRQIPEHRQPRAFFVRGDEHREGHVGARRGGAMAIAALHPVVRLVLRNRLDRHRNTTVLPSLRKTRRSPTAPTARASPYAAISRPVRINSRPEN